MSRKVYVTVAWDLIVHLEEGEDLEEVLIDCTPQNSSLEDAVMCFDYKITDSK